MTVAEYIAQLSRRLAEGGLCFGHGTDNPQDEACYLVFASLSLDWNEFENLQDRPLTADEIALLDQRARRRLEERIPVAYLTGICWFAGHRFRCDERALIPRSPIAELIGNHFEPLLPHDPGRILDLCCGGGCIGIAAALAFPEARLDLADISPDALQLAAENVELHGIRRRTELRASDLFEGLQGRRYDLILCNPPYVGQTEFEDLPAEYGHEPALGLLCDAEGLDIPVRVLREAADHLTDQGILVMEVGYSQSLLSERCPDVPFLWLDFEQGGGGVFMLTRSQLIEYRDSFR